MSVLTSLRQKATTWLLVPVVVVLLIGPVPLLGTPAAEAQEVVIDNPLGSLKTVSTPNVKNLNQFLKTQGKGNAIDPRARAAAIALGKALFWDQAVGSDGQACASCHFNAGADSRTFNQVDPGLRALPPDPVFDGPFAANIQLLEAYFPFSHIPGINDIVSSQGVFDRTFVSIDPAACPTDAGPIGFICDVGSAGSNFPAGFLDIFYPGRNVEPRNTPTTINAVFNFRNFWDGRARNEFNGVNPIGDLDPTARVWLNDGTGLHDVTLTGDLRLENSSLASQAVGPPLSDMEMSFRGRTFPDLGRKMLLLPNALPGQLVHPEDSVLGKNNNAGVESNYPDAGINKSYVELIQAAFQERWWNGGDVGTGFTQMEANFSLFWGLAVQMYESTLRADDSPFDRAFDSGDPMTHASDKWGDQEKLGLEVFNGKGKCVNCHGGPETTNASVRYVTGEKLSRMLMGNNEPAVYDEGFYNTAVRKCKIGEVCDDRGLGETIGPLNLPLSMSRFFQLVVDDDPIVAAVCSNTPEACVEPKVKNIPPKTLDPEERVAVDGAFKTPGLRNIALQAPFFHNGGDLSLLHTVEFYDRGGNFPGINEDDLDPDIVSLGLTEEEEDALVALMEAMTDERVRLQKAPFDHPQLFIPDLGELPAVGADGSAPLPTFFENLQ